MTRVARLGLALGAIATVVLPIDFARACTMAYPRFKLLSNFDVIVTVPVGQPLDGIRVRICNFDQKPKPLDTTVAETFTDKDGRATFRGLKPGHNFMLV